MLFRADFVRQKHVPGSIETNHGSLSKIIGNCWKALPLEEKHVWEVKAKLAKAEHKVRYPDYRFRPVHNKNKDKKKEKPSPSVEDERRCERVAQFLLEGKKGDELAAAVHDLDHPRGFDDHQFYHPNPLPPHPALGHRRSSSVPLPTPHLAMPTLPFLAVSRPDSPVGNISRSTRFMLGQRRASSARPAIQPLYPVLTPDSLQHDDSPLPEVDTSLFEPSFLESNFSFHSSRESTFHLQDMFTSLSPHDLPSLGPLDSIPPNHLHPQYITTPTELDPHAWLPVDPTSSQTSSSYPSSVNSTSPESTHSLLPLSMTQDPVVLAPQPQHHHQPRFSAIWKDFTRALEDGSSQAQQEFFSDPPSLHGGELPVFEQQHLPLVGVNAQDGLGGLGFGMELPYQMGYQQQQQQQQSQSQALSSSSSSFADFEHLLERSGYGCDGGNMIQGGSPMVAPHVPDLGLQYCPLNDRPMTFGLEYAGGEMV